MNQRAGDPERDFIRAMVAEDLRTGKYGGRVVTRFPPEPNGYLHIGHAKAICVDFGLAEEHDGGRCHLRFDDTNPAGESVTYAESIQRDIRWLGFDWGEHLYYASDYFERLYEYAVGMIRRGRAYVDSLTEEEIRAYRGTVTEPGRPSPHRARTVEENLDLFERMRAGAFADGAHVLRARIDMAAPNMVMRDPVLYRIRRAHHYRAGDAWCIYPLYDFAHCLSDAIEDVTYSLCSLEFKDNRELYDWVLDAAEIPRPRTEQTEFARLNLDYTVLSKRRLVRLVKEGHVSGWDDPRMPTLAGLRRRGVTPEAIRAFCDLIGVARVDSRVDYEKLEHCIRDDLNRVVPRVLCVLRPLKVVITNYPEGQVEELEAPYYPRDVPREGSRGLPFSRELFIERDDFEEEPPPGFFRLAPGREVRLRYAYLIRCDEVVKDPATGEVAELRCTYDPESKGGKVPGGRKVKGTLHWVSAAHALPVEVRLYDRLFLAQDPEDVPEGSDFTANLNPHSVDVVAGARIEAGVAADPPGSRYQFERLGYFTSDLVDSAPEALVFNRTVGLRDTWAKIAARDRAEPSSTPSPAPRVSKAPRPAPPARAGRERPPELEAAYHRLVREDGVPRDDADLVTADPAVVALYDAAVAVHDDPPLVARWIVNEVLPAAGDGGVDGLPFGGAHVGTLARLVGDGTLTHASARSVLSEMLRHGEDPEAIVRRGGFERMTDGHAVRSLVEQVIDGHPEEVARYRAGKEALLGFFVGQVMKASRGRADAEAVKALVRDGLEEG